jgi:nucleoid DNA-binding protein
MNSQNSQYTDVEQAVHNHLYQTGMDPRLVPFQQALNTGDLMKLHHELCVDRGIDPNMVAPDFVYLTQISAERNQRKINTSSRKKRYQDPLSQSAIGGTSLLSALKAEMKGYDFKFITQLVNYIFGYIIWQLVYGKQTVRTPLGTFRRHYRPPRRVFNAHTGMYQNVAGSYTVKFRPSSETKRLMNPPSDRDYRR